MQQAVLKDSHDYRKAYVSMEVEKEHIVYTSCVLERFTHAREGRAWRYLRGLPFHCRHLDERGYLFPYGARRIEKGIHLAAMWLQNGDVMMFWYGKDVFT